MVKRKYYSGTIRQTRSKFRQATTFDNLLNEKKLKREDEKDLNCKWDIFSIFAGPPKKCFPIKIVTAQRVPKNQISWMNVVEMLREDFQVSFAREFRIKKPILWMKFQYWLPDFFWAYVLTGSHMFCAARLARNLFFIFNDRGSHSDLFSYSTFLLPGNRKKSFHVLHLFNIHWLKTIFLRLATAMS